MVVRVIIPTLNEEGSIQIVLEEIREYMPNALVTVIDGQSTDKTREKARKWAYPSSCRKEREKDQPSPRKPWRLPVYLTPEEVAAMLAASERRLRDHCILEFLYSTGVRVSELTSMKVEDLDTVRITP